MTTSVRAILIDPKARAISEIDLRVLHHETEDSDGGAAHLVELINCMYLTTCRYDKFHTLFLDDNGLANPQGWFTIPSYPQPLTGPAVLVCSTSYGDVAPATLSVEELESQITFLRNLE